jgi:hypothetical protein
MVMGFPAYGGGPFERVGLQSGVPSSVLLIAAFLVVCALEDVAGWLLWGGNKSGGVLALGLLPFGAVFWWGFALPFPPVFAIVRTTLILAGWRALR